MKFRLFALLAIIGIAISGFIVSCGGSADFSNQQLAAPADLTVMSTEDGISLEWGAVFEASRYNIYWGISSGSYSNHTSVTTNSGMLSVGLVQLGARYFIAVTALNDRGIESGYSNEVDAVPVNVYNDNIE